MAGKRDKVVVAMSGGVDSSVAACLLAEQGYEVVGLFMRVGVSDVPAREAPGNPTRSTARGETATTTSSAGESCSNPSLASAATPRPHKGCCSASDAADARFVAGMLDVPFYALNFQADFDRIIDYFADEYVNGRTPNPCVICNDKLKFGKLVDYADAIGATYVATGHYARVGERAGRRVLMRGRDEHKDQSYVLFGLERQILDRVMFPVGELTKDEVRAIAEKFNLPNRAKPDSVDICFVPDRDYARVVKERRPEAFVEGAVLNGDGETIGRHQGVANYTIGQRRGLGIAAGKPIYVTRLNVAKNTVTMGPDEDLLQSTLIAGKHNFLVDPPGEPFRARVKIRYLHKAAPATVEVLRDDATRSVSVVFDEPQRAITPGQAVVFYDGDVVLGGAWIEGADCAAYSGHDLKEEAYI